MKKERSIFRKIFQFIGILLAIPIGLIFIVFIGIRTYSYVTQTNYSKIIESKEFKAIETFVFHKPELRSFAILPNTNFIVMNGTIINQKSKTFGTIPVLGSYSEYYNNGMKNNYRSLDSLLVSISSSMTETEINVLIFKMRSLDLIDIQKNDSCNETIFSWAVSAMWGEEGIIKTDCPPSQNDYNERIKINEISRGYYKFKRF